MFAAKKSSSQSGQVALIVLLLMVALLVAGLSLASRTAQDLMLSTSQLESSRVFSAAEAGIEEALSSEFDFAGSEQLVELGSDYYEGANVSYSINKHSLLDVLIFEGVVVKVDLAGVAAATSPALKIDWSVESNCLTEEPASLLISVYSQDAGVSKVRHYALAGCDRGDEFELAGASSESGLNFYYQLPLTTNDLFARIRPVYNGTRIKIEGVNFSLPTQYLSIRSQAENSSGDEVRIVTVERSLPAQPSVFDFVLFSGDTLIK